VVDSYECGKWTLNFLKYREFLENLGEFQLREHFSCDNDEGFVTIAGESGTH